MYSRIVDLPVPRPPITALYCGLKSSVIGPRNLLFETSSRITWIEGILGSTCEMREWRARHAWRSASAVGIAHFTQVECMPRFLKSRVRLSDVWKSPIALLPQFLSFPLTIERNPLDLGGCGNSPSTYPPT